MKQMYRWCVWCPSAVRCIQHAHCVCYAYRSDEIDWAAESGLGYLWYDHFSNQCNPVYRCPQVLSTGSFLETTINKICGPPTSSLLLHPGNSKNIKPSLTLTGMRAYHQDPTAVLEVNLPYLQTPFRHSVRFLGATGHQRARSTKNSWVAVCAHCKCLWLPLMMRIPILRKPAKNTKHLPKTIKRILPANSV